MAAVETTLIPLGFKAPDFHLPDVVTGKTATLTELKGSKATVFMFICNHCPYVIHVREELIKMALDYSDKGISFVAISSNDVSRYPADAPEKMKDIALEFNFPFPYLYDETQAVAKAYYAACTPDFSIFDKDLRCVYRGQLDSSRPSNGKPVTGQDMRDALDSILSGEEVNSVQLPSIGCNIKWKI